MLEHLSIKNYLLIEELELDLRPGFSAITGETGAGKSILIGALSMILGNRTDTDVMLDKESKCIVEGSFDVDENRFKDLFSSHELDLDGQIVLRREIAKNGKSRAFINDTPVKLPLMKEVGEKLVDIHSQHQTLLLGDSGFQLSILDDYADNREAMIAYRNIYFDYLHEKELLKELKSRKSKLQAEEDFVRFQFEELENAALQEGELALLEEEQEVLSNAEEIKSHLFNSVQALQMSDNNLVDRLSEVTSLLSKISAFHREINELYERVQSTSIELKDIANSLSNLEEDINHDPNRLEEVNERLDLIYKLQQKHKVQSIEELSRIKDDLGTRLESIDNIDEDISSAEKNVIQLLSGVKEKNDTLHINRQKVLGKLEASLRDILVQLGMEKVVVKIKMEDLPDYGEWGREAVEFMFSANPGSPPAPVSRIASGGEMSRIMLAMKSLLTKKNLLPTVILDEIDMGVSGEVASRVGNLLKEMSENMQLIAITHLPQIAGKAAQHFRVFKKYDDERTVSEVIRLSSEERIDEIAAMMSNENVSLAARETAKELLK